jgi:hypothetical protein
MVVRLMAGDGSDQKSGIVGRTMIEKTRRASRE